MHEELIKNIRSIKQRLGIGVITTLNGTDHHLMNQLDKMEELVNKNFALAVVVGQSEQLPDDDEEETKCPDHTPYWGVCSTCGEY